VIHDAVGGVTSFVDLNIRVVLVAHLNRDESRRLVETPGL